MKYSLIILGLSLNIAFTQCDNLSEPQCGFNINCEWTSNIVTGNCSSLSDGECNNYEGCYLQNNYPGWYDGSWTCEGGTYQIDNGYCEDATPLECSEIDYELQCNQDSECNWVEDVETASCSSLPWDICDLPQYGSCYSDCTQWGTYYSAFCYGTMYCTGGTYQNDSSYCQESYIPGDANSDGSLNVSDVVLIVDSILNSQYNEYSDVNQDGVLSVIDIIDLINIILGD